MASRKRAKQKQAQKRTSRRRTQRANRNRRTAGKSSNATDLKKLKKWFLPTNGIFAGLKQHGNTRWSPVDLVWLALCWAWGESQNTTDAFDDASTQCRRLGVVPLTTYQGFMNALVTWTVRLMLALQSVLHQRMQQIGGAHWQVGGWVPIAFDGSRSSTPSTKSNEKAFCAPNYGKGKTAKYRRKKTKGMRRTKNEKHKPQAQAPQAWITLLWHMGLRLPWTWRLGPSNSSERAHVTEMIADEKFPENTLFCGDAGFIGRPLWEHIASRGFHFLVRVGANVSLLTESEDVQIKDGEVLCWPNEVVKKGGPPLRLRLVKVKVGPTWMWMLTNVLDRSKLTEAQIVDFYKARWGIEVEFRGLKQTLDCGKLRCRNEQRVLAELNWSIMAMAVAELFALKEQLQPDPRASEAPPPDPKKRSLANAVRALRTCLKNLADVPAPGEDLRTKLEEARTDGYTRTSSKRSRRKRKNPDKKPLGNPSVRPLTPQHKKRINELELANDQNAA